MKQRLNLLFLLPFFLTQTACTGQSAQGRMALAEKLFSEGKYEAAVGEFERVVGKDPGGSLGLLALQKAAEIQTLYLAQHTESLKKLKNILDLVGPGEAAWNIKKEIARIHFEKTEQFELALASYQELLGQRAEGSEAPQFLYRIGKSFFFLWRFEQAVKVYRDLALRFPGTLEAELGSFEIGATYLTAGDRIPGAYGMAKTAFEDFIQKFPRSSKMPEARFGIGNCLEEMEQLPEAQAVYEKVQNDFPSPNVVKIRLIRLQERLNLKKGKNEKSK